jgi:pimeloyl-ACP methyl ester carboxylesterase
MKRKFLFALLAAIVIVNWTWGRLPAEPPAPAGSKYAMAEGVNFHYVETPGREPAVVMIHGHPGTYLDWAYVQQKLEGRRTIAIDRPGYGYSSGEYISFEDQVSAIHALTKKLKLERPVIAGHSYGGTLAIAYAAKYPRDTHAIVPIDPAVSAEDIDSFALVQARFVKALQLPIVEPVANATFNQALLTATSGPQVKKAFEPDPVNPDYEEQLKAVNLKSSDLKTFADETLDVKSDLESLTGKYESIKTRAVFVQGIDDQLVDGAVVWRRAADMPRSRYISLPGGHMQTWVHPTQVARAITSAAR